MPENSNNSDNSSNSNNGNGSSWAMYQRLVLSEIERLDKDRGTLFKKLDELDSGIHKELSDDIAGLKKEWSDSVANIKDMFSGLDKSIAILQTKAAVYGALGGAIFAGIIEFVVYFFSNGGHK